MQIGKNLKKIRKQKELTQIQLAEISGISRNALINYENDKRIPSIDTLSKLAKALKIEKTIFYFDIENEVMTNEDVLYLLQSLFPEEYYSFDEFLNAISNLMEDDIRITSSLLLGAWSDKDQYYKLGEKLELNENQVYNWILSDCISNTELDFSLHPDDIKEIIKNDVLTKQSIDELLDIGLSEESIETIYDYFSDSTDNGSNIRLKKLISQKENITIKNNDYFKLLQENNELKEKMKSLKIHLKK
ncbi:helix-turn-helix domain-containing protein [Clostridioides difficile]|uniref:helix-turn-helix domain-containing protein n=1 Tax=Clostridioides difficile TaxID=1496 RepID=UPI001F30D31C|nr:helix-turn-helix transcriptional regulator [Clostridioides difficile]